MFQYCPVFQSDCHKHIHFSNTILWVFTSLFYKVQISPDYFYPGKKTLTGLQRKYSTQEDAKYDLKVSFLTLFRKPCQYGNILAESICMLLTKKGFFCSRSSERILILVFLWCKATNFRGINVHCLASFVPRILLCFLFRGSSRPSPLPIDFRVSEKELVNQFYNLILGFPGIKLQRVIRQLSPTTEDKHFLRSAFIRLTVTTRSHLFF